jgi:hypothetical protein
MCNIVGPKICTARPALRHAAWSGSSVYKMHSRKWLAWTWEACLCVCVVHSSTGHFGKHTKWRCTALHPHAVWQIRLWTAIISVAWQDAVDIHPVVCQFATILAYVSYTPDDEPVRVCPARLQLWAASFLCRIFEISCDSSVASSGFLCVIYGRCHNVCDTWIKCEYAALMEWRWQGKTQILGEKPVSTATLSTTNPTRTALRSNPCHRGEWPATTQTEPRRGHWDNLNRWNHMTLHYKVLKTALW